VALRATTDRAGRREIYRHRMTATDHSLRCPACGDVVGVYEPAVALIADGGRVHSSLAKLGGDLPVAEIYHRDCAPSPGA